MLSDLKEILTVLIVTLIKQHKHNTGVTHPSWMTAQTPRPPPACCSLVGSVLSPLQTVARASLLELPSPAP